VIKESIGQGYEKYSSYLLTVFFFILFNNLLGLIPIFPGGANVTGNITITMTLAICTFLIVNLFAPTKEYWKGIFWPDIPLFLKCPIPLMPFVEVFGLFTKPFSLMIRLFANMMAGHTIIVALTSLIFITTTMGIAVNAGMTVVSIAFTIFMNLLELLVAALQAYIFTILSASYIGLAKHPA
jgi:F-type H+-transporting ATPase subunit a